MPEITKSGSTKSLEQIEQERLTRRQALRKLGFGAGLSAFMLLGVDDLARMVGAEMQKRAGDSKVANQIAKEFQSAGVALASPSGSGGTICDHCCTQYQYDMQGAIAEYCYCVTHSGSGCKGLYNQKKNDAEYSYNTCRARHCSGTEVCITDLTPPDGCTMP